MAHISQETNGRYHDTDKAQAAGADLSACLVQSIQVNLGMTHVADAVEDALDLAAAVQRPARPV